MTHNLTIVSLNDAQLECSCGWQMFYSGAMTPAGAKKEHAKHRYEHFRTLWKRTHSISPPPSFSSWYRRKKEYGDA